MLFELIAQMIEGDDFVPEVDLEKFSENLTADRNRWEDLGREVDILPADGNVIQACEVHTSLSTLD